MNVHSLSWCFYDVKQKNTNTVVGCNLLYYIWLLRIKVNIRKSKNPAPALFLKMNIYSLDNQREDIDI